MPICGGQRTPPVMNENQKKVLSEIEGIANFLDVKWIRLLGIDFGADSIIGLIPGIGDTITASISAWIAMRIFCAFDNGLKWKMIPVLFNILVDYGIGTIPLAGDIFDIYWKANVKNINIVRKHYGMDPLPMKPEDDQQQQQTKGRRSRGDVEMTNASGEDA